MFSMIQGINHLTHLITKSLKILFMKAHQTSVLLKVEVSYKACLCVYVCISEPLLHPFLPSVFYNRRLGVKDYVVKTASSMNPSWESDIALVTPYASVLFLAIALRAEEMGSESQVINTYASPISKTNTEIPSI